MAKREQKVEDANELPALEAGVSEIKDLFRAGAVPREADYVKLIEYVHYLHKLLGVEGVDGIDGPGPGEGLSSAKGLLSVGVHKGIEISDNKVGLSDSINSYIYRMGKLFGATHCAFDGDIFVLLAYEGPAGRDLVIAKVFARGIEFLGLNPELYKLNGTLAANKTVSELGRITGFLVFNNTPEPLETIEVYFEGTSAPRKVIIDIKEIGY